MSSDRAPNSAPELWQPHPDDDANIAEALEAANRRDLLSPEASEAFVRWMEGSGDDSWRAELEQRLGTLASTVASSTPAPNGRSRSREPSIA